MAELTWSARPMKIQTTLFRTTDRIADLLGLLRDPFDADELVELARLRAGATRYPAPESVEPLRRLLASLDQEAELSVIGRRAVHWDVLRLLGNVLRFAQEEARDPAITGQPIARPVFVLGLPRSGTSFLHTLFATDPAVQAPRCWQMVHPWPINRPGEPDLRIRIADRQLRLFAFLAPDFPHMHPIDGNSTQECTEITAHCFRSLRFDMLHHIPSYRAWLDGVGHMEAYGFHRRFLQHLQHQNTPAGAAPGRWVLKCPDHVFALEAVRAIYPDAHLVILHRDPLKVLGSVAKLTDILRAPFTRALDREAIGRQVARHWLLGARRLTARTPDPAHETHIHYRDLIADPISTVRMLYERTGLEFSPAVAARMAGYVANHPNGGYGQHRYRLEDYGLDRHVLAEQFAPYMRHFDIDSEEV
jgi:hypothetical protein